jgi:hypothetical protein
MMAYIDIFWIVTVAYALMLPFIFLMKPKKGGAPVPTH